MQESLISIEKVKNEEFLILENLMSLYLHDLSSYSKELRLNPEGRFIYDGLGYYLRESELFPYFICYSGVICGFVLINSGSYVAMAVDYSIHEFFILKSYRKEGLGRAAVKLILKQFPGRYKIEELITNIPAINFWRKTYEDIGISYNEMREKSDGEEYIIQIFKV